MKWPHYQKYVNQIIVNIKISLKLNFINIQSLHSNSPGCTSFLESNFLEILVLCETFSTRSSNFSLQGYLPLIWKDSMTLCIVLQLFEEANSKRDLSLENSEDSYLRFRLALLHLTSVSSLYHSLFL